VLEELEAFCRVVEEASFTAAARRLHLSQPAVTKQVARLEQRLGLRLLDRRARQIQPTSQGRLVYAYAKRVTTSVIDLLATVKDINSPGKGDVWVGSVTTIALYTLPPLFARYTARWPDVRLHVKTGQIQDTLDRVLHNDVDIGFVTVPVIHTDLITAPLFEDPIDLVASPAFAKKIPSPLSTRDLSQVPFVAYQTSSRFRAFVDAALEKEGVLPQVVMEFDSHEAVITMVSLGFGVALVPRSSVRGHVERGTLIRIDADVIRHLSRTTSLIMRQDAHRSPALLSFLGLTLDMLLERRPGSPDRTLPIQALLEEAPL